MPNKIAAVKDEVNKLSAAGTAYGAAYRQVVDTNSKQAQQYALAVESTKNKIAGLKTTLATLEKQQAAQKEAQQASNQAMNSGQTRAEQLSAATARLTAAEKTSSTAVTSMTNALNILDGNYLSAQSATIAQKQALASLSTALKTAHGNLSSNSTASLAAQQAANSYATSLYGTLIPSMAKAGDSTHAIYSASMTSVNGFINAARAAGDTGQQAQALAAKYHLIPRDVTTAIRESGAAQVAQAAQGALSALSGLNRIFTSTITTNHVSTYRSVAIGGGRVAHNAGGTPNFAGGLSWVGEAGPELMKLPAGTAIFPHAKSVEMAKPRTVIDAPQPVTAGLGTNFAGALANSLRLRMPRQLFQTKGETHASVTSLDSLLNSGLAGKSRAARRPVDAKGDQRRQVGHREDHRCRLGEPAEGRRGCEHADEAAPRPHQDVADGGRMRRRRACRPASTMAARRW